MNLRELKKSILRMFRPPPKTPVSQWADENRVLVSESSSEPGRWRTDRAPYQRAIMDAFTQAGIWKIVMMASAQTGKSETELNMMGRAIDIDPGPMLFVQPTDDFAKDFSKRRVSSMIRACRVLTEKVYEAKSRDSSNTLQMKTFPGGSLAITGANSPTELAGRPVRYLFMDEVDRFPASAGTEGDPVLLAERRTETFYNRKVVLTSTPTIKGKSKIEAEYMAGTQEEWHVKCPKCGAYSYIRFSDIQFQKSAYDQDGKKHFRVDKVSWRCPACKEESDEYEVKRSDAKWVSRNPGALKDGIRSFRLNAFMSPWSEWKKIVAFFLDAKDDPERLKVFYNTVLGETWEIRDRSGKPEKLHARREHYNAEAPTGVLVLTMGIDTQDNRLEYEVVGWGRNEESWGISHGVIPGRADAPGVWEEVDILLAREWKMANGKAMRISATFIDSGGHFTQEVYDACKKRQNKRIWPIKGEGGEDKPYVRLSKKSDMALFMLGVDSGKEAILHATGIEIAGPRYMHFPIEFHCGYDEKYFKGLISEQMVIHRRAGKAVVVWEKLYDQNEPLDCRNYARAAFKYFNWDLNGIERRLNGIMSSVIPVQTAKPKKPKYVVSPGIKL